MKIFPFFGKLSIRVELCWKAEKRQLFDTPSHCCQRGANQYQSSSIQYLVVLRIWDLGDVSPGLNDGGEFNNKCRSCQRAVVYYRSVPACILPGSNRFSQNQSVAFIVVLDVGEIFSHYVQTAASFLSRFRLFS